MEKKGAMRIIVKTNEQKKRTEYAADILGLDERVGAADFSDQLQRHQLEGLPGSTWKDFEQYNNNNKNIYIYSPNK